MPKKTVTPNRKNTIINLLISDLANITMPNIIFKMISIIELKVINVCKSMFIFKPRHSS